jgi:RHS repeat-associated protein
VLSQGETQYDANGNAILTISRERLHDETATGALDDPSTTPHARVSYAAAYYDTLDRLTATVDVGTNGGLAWSRPGTVPTGSATVLVSSASYNAAGWLDTTTDPRGIVAKSFYDNLGRVTKSVEAYVDGGPSAGDDKTTEFGYDGDDHLLTLQADLPGGAYQKTLWLYGATTATGNDVTSNDLLVAVRHPDKATGSPSASEQETYTVNALGQTKTYSDRNGTTHSYSYDVLGRGVADALTTLGSGVDGSVRRLETAYDTAGRPYLFTSFDAAAGGNVVNQVEDLFNGLGQLTSEYQAHLGGVNPSTTPRVQYAYTEMAGGANNSRPVSLTYPNGRVLSYNDNAGLDNAISRLSSLSDNTATLETYTYLGLATVVKRGHPQPGVDLSYLKRAGEANGDAGDQYTGLDRFGRVVDQRWLSSSTGVATDRFKYGYDPDGNVLYRTNELNHNFDELYHANGAANGYDLLNQVTAFSRGVLSDSNSDGVPDTVASPSHSQGWGIDALGNFSSVTTDGTTQTRSANAQNEITALSGATTPGYDANGNTTADDAGRTLVYDGWNRLTVVKLGASTVDIYGYDASGRRISENPGTQRDLYYSAAWQVLEERAGSQVQVQYVWSAVYVDALVERDRDADGNAANGLEERLYVQQAANWDVTAVLDAAGNVLERYADEPYGNVASLTAGWATLTSSSLGWHYLHQGSRFDPASGLYDNRNRVYSPTLIRWLQSDPLGFGAWDSNLYRYEANQPGNGVDPSGLVDGNTETRWYDFTGVAPAVEIVYRGFSIVGMWHQQHQLDAKLDETMRRIQDKRDWVADYGNPNINMRGVGGNTTAGSMVNAGANPNFHRNAEQAVGDATLLAVGGVIWTAAGPSWVSPSNYTFVWRNRGWFNLTKNCDATAAEAAQAEAALANASRAAGAGRLGNLGEQAPLLGGIYELLPTFYRSLLVP